MSDLASVLAKRERLDVEHATHIVMRCCTALAGAEYRGITPAMLAMSPTGEISVDTSDVTKQDFGYVAPEVVAHAQSTARIVERHFDGMRGYGVIRASEHDDTDWRRAAVFSLGCILWELLAGRPLFRSISDYHSMMLAAAAEVPPLPGVPEELDAIVRKALAKTIDARYQTAEQFGDALADYLARGLN